MFRQPAVFIFQPKLLYFSQCLIFHFSCTIGGAIYRIIMHQHQLTVFRLTDINLYNVHFHPNSTIDSRQGVFGGNTPISTVRHHQYFVQARIQYILADGLRPLCSQETWLQTEK